MSKRHNSPSPHPRKRLDIDPELPSASVTQVFVPSRRKQRFESRTVFGSDSLSQPTPSTSVPSTSSPIPVTTITPVETSVRSVVPKRRKQIIQPIFDPSTEPFVEFQLIDTLDSRYNSKFMATEQWLRYKVHHNLSEFPNLLAIQSAVDNAYERVMEPFMKGLADDDMIGGYIEHEALKTSIAFRPIPVGKFNKEEFLNRIYCVSQSKQCFLLDGTLIFRVVTYKKLRGSGRGNNAALTYSEVNSMKRSVIEIYNSDDSCGYRAIALGIQYHVLGVKGNSRQTNWCNLIRKDRDTLKNVMIEFCMDFDLDYTTPLDYDIIKALDSRTDFDYQIIVIRDCKPVFKGIDRPKVIYLLHTDNHFDFITSMPAFTEKHFFCKKCNKGYNRASKHRCEDSCFYCRSPFQCIPTESQQCPDCLLTFVSPKCFDYHKKSKICLDRHYCPQCEVVYTVDRKRKHVCHELYCPTCRQYYSVQPHYCYMTPLDDGKLKEEDGRLKIFIAFDIECMLEKSGETFTHNPILLISHTVCDICLSSGKCDICRKKERVFYGTECVSRFVQYLLDFSKTAKEKKAWVTVFAHNNSGYDGHWVLRELANRNIKGMDATLNGTKIMKLDAGNLRFIDSLLLFQRPLSDLPKMFGLTGEVKGFFPHYLNTPENQDLSLCLCQIPPEKFGRNQMTIKKAAQFDYWYKTNGRMIYDLKEEMIRYCRSDVSILLKAMLSFRKLFIETTGIDPLTRTFTLASIGLEFFRAKLLPENTIGITPIGGYNNYRMQSASANAWLDVMEQRWGPIIREYKIGRFYADGVRLRPYCEKGKQYSMIAFEYNGCHWHGHNCGGNWNREKFEEVEKKRVFYEKQGIYPNFVWECEWIRTASPVVRKRFEERLEYHIKMAPKEEPKEKKKKVSKEKEKKEKPKPTLYCDPRLSYHGGRTNNLMFTWTAGPDERLRYLDFTSLYPYVLATNPFPGGHPTVYRQYFPPIDKVFGFISCKVLPPKNLYLPVLPLTIDGKLMFPLCRTCAEERLNESCPHNAEQRSFTGSFVSKELQKAMALGYQVVDTYEVLHYERQITDVFQEYVKRWYKLKAEASGFPSECKTAEEKERYLSLFEENEGFALEPNKICSNPGLRSISKLMLNSFYGKLAQRPDLPITKIVKYQPEMWNIYNNEKLDVTGDVILENLMLISYRHKDIKDCRVGNTSVAIASFVTAYARLMLYDEMERIEASTPGSVLYFDTDSIVFVQRDNTYEPRIGQFLGMMTDEIADEYGTDARLTEFHSIGPKTYAFKIETSSGPKYSLKAKGLSQTVDSSPVLNFSRIKQMAQNTSQSLPSVTASVPQNQFRTSAQHIVSSHHMTKKFEVTSDKRRVIGNFTLPYGFDDRFMPKFISNDIDVFAQLMIN